MANFNFDSLPPIDLLPADVVELVHQRDEIKNRYSEATAELVPLITGSGARDAREADAAATVELVKQGKPGTREHTVAFHAKLNTARRTQADLDATLRSIDSELSAALTASADTITTTAAQSQADAATRYQKATAAFTKAREQYHASLALVDWANRIINDNGTNIVFDITAPSLTINEGRYSEATITAGALYEALDRETRTPHTAQA